MYLISNTIKILKNSVLLF